MGNELKILDHGFSIVNSATSIAERALTLGDVRVERKAANKMRYAFHTFEGARSFINNSTQLSDRDVERCEALLDEFTYRAMEDIRNTGRRW